MHSTTKRVMSLLALGIIATPPPALADDMTVNRLLASQCAQCHGSYGYAVGDIDSLAGEEEKDLIEDLQDMRGEDEPENIMDHQALGYTEDQIRRIASYYSTLAEPKDSEDESEDESEDDSESKSEKKSKEYLKKKKALAKKKRLAKKKALAKKKRLAKKKALAKKKRRDKHED